MDFDLERERVASEIDWEISFAVSVSCESESDDSPPRDEEGEGMESEGSEED